MSTLWCGRSSEIDKRISWLLAQMPGHLLGAWINSLCDILASRMWDAACILYYCYSKYTTARLTSALPSMPGNPCLWTICTRRKWKITICVRETMGTRHPTTWVTGYQMLCIICTRIRSRLTDNSSWKWSRTIQKQSRPLYKSASNVMHQIDERYVGKFPATVTLKP